MDVLKLSLEYMCSSVWLVYSDGGLDDIGPEKLPISKDLKHDILKWNRIYQSTLDQNYPPDSGFSSEAANNLLWSAFQKEGESLFARLKAELEGKYEVISHEYGLSNQS